mmetsp:Transcript_9861/g.38392  ORF Transcript_9861/g.38392 Transcript_9861/m.38392 type:complete len:104 (+) Transcript_9861:1464-1775(+)
MGICPACHTSTRKGLRAPGPATNGVCHTSRGSGGATGGQGRTGGADRSSWLASVAGAVAGWPLAPAALLASTGSGAGRPAESAAAWNAVCTRAERIRPGSRGL